MYHLNKFLRADTLRQLGYDIFYQSEIVFQAAGPNHFKNIGPVTTLSYS
jgi:hypothetical protein